MILTKKSKICILGHRGMVGSAVYKHLRDRNYNNIITVTKDILDLTNQYQTDKFLDFAKPDVVILAAARVGGIRANIENPATFLSDNLLIQENVILAAVRNNVKQFVFLGSSCIYPSECQQPMKEEYLLTGPLEATNEGYAIAKIAGIKLLEYLKKQNEFNSISIMPCNLYGPHDSFDLRKSHVLSALVKRFVDAKIAKTPDICLWGTGVARREFMHVDDLARAISFLLEKIDHCSFINVGVGYDISVSDLANKISDYVGYSGNITWDSSMPDGMLRKCLDISKMNRMGFKAKISLDDGIREMIEIYTRSRKLS